MVSIYSLKRIVKNNLKRLPYRMIVIKDNYANDKYN